MDKNEQYIINACVANDPSIMELKFGAKIKILKGKPEIATFIQEFNSCYDSFIDRFPVIQTLGKKEFPFEILGRDIYLHDVLGAIKKIGIEDILVNVNGDFIVSSWSEEIGEYLYGTGIVWNLKKPLHKQTEETKLLLARLLGFKE